MDVKSRSVREKAGAEISPVAVGRESEMVSVVVHRDDSPRPIDLWLNSIMNGRGVSESTDKASSSKSQNIQRVPEILRQIDQSNKKCFEPLVVPIGPYHRGNDALKSAEKFKIALTQQYVKTAIDLPKEHSKPKFKVSSIHQAFEKVKKVASDARKCYAEDPSMIDLDEEDFTKMMFLDGCFVMEYIYSTVYNKFDELKIMKSHDIAFVKRDLFLLENQLPFKVLKALMEIRFDDSNGTKMIHEFIGRTMATTREKDSYIKKEIRRMARKLFGRKEEKKHERRDEPAHLLDFMWNELIDRDAFKAKDQNAQNAGEKGNDWYSYRSAQELKTAGIHFRPSETRRFTDVKYENQCYRAVLRLPAMTIDDSAKSLLLNLVAYEMCPNGPEVFGVSSYLWFMDTLIDNDQDVKELRRKGILLNFLSSDEQVAKLFNEIAIELVPNPYAYEDVKEKIEWHYKQKVYLWMTEWINTHFSTPWTVLAFLGAILAISSSIAQTYYAAQPNEPKIIVVRPLAG